MLLNLLASQLLWLLFVADVESHRKRSNAKDMPLSWRQKEYYQKSWKQRMRFTTTPRPGTTPEPDELRKVYPCYCYRPPQPGQHTTEPYEKYMIETRDLFILNK